MKKTPNIATILVGIIIVLCLWAYYHPNTRIITCHKNRYIEEEYPDSVVKMYYNPLEISGTPGMRCIAYVSFEFSWVRAPEKNLRVEFGGVFTILRALTEDVIIQVYNCSETVYWSNITWNNAPCIGTRVGNITITVDDLSNSYYVVKYLDVSNYNVDKLAYDTTFVLLTDQDILVSLGSLDASYFTEIPPHVRYFFRMDIPIYNLLLIIGLISIISILLSIPVSYFRKLRENFSCL